MYKKIMLSLLLLPCMVFSKSDRDCQIQQLKKAQRDKEEEIALIIKAIDEKENFIDSVFLKVQNIYQNLNDEYDGEIEGAIDLFIHDLEEAIMHHKSITPYLNKDFTDNDSSKFELKRMKYLAIRYVFEYMNLYQLVQQYEKYVQELFEINNKLEKLEK